MDLQTYVDSLRRDGAALADAADGHLRLPVPSCPEWTMSDLVWHVGEVHLFWREIAERLLVNPREVRRQDRPADEDIVAWYRDGTDRLADVLLAADPAAPVWTWASQKNVAFIQRRMPQETAVHRWDGQNARGAAQPIDPILAADGVDEYLQLMLPADPGRLSGPGEVIGLQAGDTGDRWLVRVSPESVTFERTQVGGSDQAGETPDARARASASDLLLLLWRRVDPSAVQVDGDLTAMERFLDRADLT